MASTAEGILIVDDEPSLLRMMSLYLGRIGYSVTVASSIQKARTEWTSSGMNFAVVVLDATLSGGTLSELGKEILSQSPDVRLIAASGYPVDMSELESIAPGRVAFLHKPFSPEMLADAVRRMLGS
jgi:two-component system, cell cycle sensor histidine kinase and response regulator CckA